MKNKKVFITVGTTRFDALIETILSHETLQTLNKLGYHILTMQTGNSTLPEDVDFVNSYMTEFEHFKFAPSLENYIQSSDLVIGHAGAGTCMEVLNAKKPLIAVVNNTLMASHQEELAKQLAKDGYTYYCEHHELADVLKTKDLTKLKTDFSDKSAKVAAKIDEIMEFQ